MSAQPYYPPRYPPRQFPSVYQAIHYLQLIFQPHRLCIWSREQITINLGPSSEAINIGQFVICLKFYIPPCFGQLRDCSCARIDC